MICEFCHKENKQFDSHHLIPRQYSGNDEDIIQVCRSCHRKLDNFMKNFIFNIDVKEWHDKKKRKKWQNNHRQVKFFKTVSFYPDGYLSMNIVKTKNNISLVQTYRTKKDGKYGQKYLCSFSL